MSSDTRVVAVSFASLHGDPYERNVLTGEVRLSEDGKPTSWGPTLRAIGDPSSMLYGRLSDWYYLCHPAVTDQSGQRTAARSAQEVALEMRRAIEEHVPSEARPQFHIVPFQTNRPPNDHADLFRFVRDYLPSVRGLHPKAELVFVLGAGTSAMQAVLFLAGSVGLVDGPVRVVGVERREGARLRPEKPVFDVTLKLDTILRVARDTVATGPTTDEAPGMGLHLAKSPALVAAREKARNTAIVPFPILLRGERGVGKTTLAKFIRASSRFRKPERDHEWPSVACGQFPDAQLLRIELCGSKKGAFTGAVDKPGLLKLAHGDTLFLDEIHDLSPDNQRVMIRLLEDGKYYPLGETRPSMSKFRLITGTNLPDDELRERLSPDFFDRIRMIEVHIPPLRDCPEDLPWMWAETWGAVAREARLDAQELDREQHESIVGRLHGQDLPGNWRDLRRLAVCLAIACHAREPLAGKPLSDLLDAFFKDESIAAASGDGLPRLEVAPSPRRSSYFSRLEDQLGPGLERFWQSCDGNRSPRQVLRDLLGSRHRARHAEGFISAHYQAAWKRLVSE